MFDNGRQALSLNRRKGVSATLKGKFTADQRNK